jgi:hypothetical protein
MSSSAKLEEKEWVDMAFGRNHGKGAPTEMKWIDMDGTFTSGELR